MKSELAGGRIVCPECGIPLEVPSHSLEDEPVRANLTGDHRQASDHLTNGTVPTCGDATANGMSSGWRRIHMTPKLLLVSVVTAFLLFIFAVVVFVHESKTEVECTIAKVVRSERVELGEYQITSEYVVNGSRHELTDVGPTFDHGGLVGCCLL